MKRQGFARRLGFAWKGVRSAWTTEASFRTQVALGAGVAVALCVLRPEPVWWALVALTIGSVLAMELANTALESIVDKLHPDVHPAIAKAKDCAAAAVLVLSAASLAVFVLMALSTQAPQP